MARDHTRVNIDVWNDDEFLELSVDAQALYWRLWTSPARTYCGTHEWHPGRLAQSAGDWTIERLRNAAAVLSERLFLIIDEATEECLLRSWIKHDGLWKQPNMAVTMADARAAVGSKILRGVIVHEVAKLRAAHPESPGWKRDQVVSLLAQKAIDPAILTPYSAPTNTPADPTDNPPPNPPINPTAKGYRRPGVNPPANPAPTTATPTPTATTVGKLGTQVTTGADLEPPPCPRHPIDTGTACRACGARRQWVERRDAERSADELEARRALKAAADACHRCDELGFIDVTDDDGTDARIRCDHAVADAVSHA